MALLVLRSRAVQGHFGKRVHTVHTHRQTDNEYNVVNRTRANVGALNKASGPIASFAKTNGRKQVTDNDDKNHR